ncbi:MAG: hypothetical protein HQ559_11305 [Lentisphaerae bacterium]|nr:hypothetical protein [Lentisphaerota bacterium]
MNQLILGAALPFAVSAAFYCRARFRASMRWLLLCPLSMLAGAAWAVLPDVPRLLGMSGLYFRLSRAPWTDVFFFHYTIDRAEVDSPLYVVGAVVMACCLLLAAWRELALREGN